MAVSNIKAVFDMENSNMKGIGPAFSLKKTDRQKLILQKMSLRRN